LDSAGYLTSTYDPASQRAKIYRLRPAMNSGPTAPKLLRGIVVYDPNRRALMGTLTATEGEQ
jgi:hypothetical protein